MIFSGHSVQQQRAQSPTGHTLKGKNTALQRKASLNKDAEHVKGSECIFTFDSLNLQSVCVYWGVFR